MIEAVLTRLRAGDKLHQQIVEGRRQWWFDEPFQDVPDAIVVKIRASGEFALKEAGDSLFGLPENSQTWGGGSVSDRVGCINPRCRRTFRREHASEEIICGKCFGMLPEAVRKEHRGYWREIRKWDRRIARTSDELKIVRMRAIRDRISHNLSAHWDVHIKTPLLAPDKPAGLDTFLEEVGL